MRLFAWITKLFSNPSLDNEAKPVVQEIKVHYLKTPESVQEQNYESIKFPQKKYLKMPARKVNRVFLHCSASDVPAHDDVQVIKAWHTDPKPRGRGWSDVGYHFFIKKDGEIQTGRSLERTPAAQGGHNRGTIAICLHGLREDKFTKNQKRSLLLLCHLLDVEYQGKLTFHGHKEVANKACPVFPYKQWLNLDAAGRIQYGGKHHE